MNNDPPKFSETEGSEVAGGAGGFTGGACDPELTNSRLRCRLLVTMCVVALVSGANEDVCIAFVASWTKRLNVDTGRMAGFLQARDNGITRPF